MCDNSKQHGSVLIMAIILGSGMLVAAVEVSMFAVSTIRQARALDHTLVAFYAAESGVESALYRIRKEGGQALREDIKQSSTLYTVDGRDARWSFLKEDGSDDDKKFNAKVQKITKTLLAEQQSVDIHLWTHENAGFSPQDARFKTMDIRWRKAECARDGDLPWIETTALVFDISPGTGVTWPHDPQTSPIKKQFIRQNMNERNDVSVDLATFLEGQAFTEKGMTLRIKSFFCALRDVEISFPDNDRPGELVPIPNYYLIRPTATYGSVSVDNLSVIMPKYGGATGIFDYLFFSEEKVQKDEQ